jgi:hypothetical protein
MFSTKIASAHSNECETKAADAELLNWHETRRKEEYREFLKQIHAIDDDEESQSEWVGRSKDLLRVFGPPNCDHGVEERHGAIGFSGKHEKGNSDATLNEEEMCHSNASLEQPFESDEADFKSKPPRHKNLTKYLGTVSKPPEKLSKPKKSILTAADHSKYDRDTVLALSLIQPALEDKINRAQIVGAESRIKKSWKSIASSTKVKIMGLVSKKALDKPETQVCESSLDFQPVQGTRDDICQFKMFKVYDCSIFEQDECTKFFVNGNPFSLIDIIRIPAEALAELVTCSSANSESSQFNEDYLYSMLRTTANPRKRSHFKPRTIELNQIEPLGGNAPITARTSRTKFDIDTIIAKLFSDETWKATILPLPSPNGRKFGYLFGPSCMEDHIRYSEPCDLEVEVEEYDITLDGSVHYTINEMLIRQDIFGHFSSKSTITTNDHPLALNSESCDFKEFQHLAAQYSELKKYGMLGRAKSLQHSELRVVSGQSSDAFTVNVETEIQRRISTTSIPEDPIEYQELVRELFDSYSMAGGCLIDGLGARELKPMK